MNGTQSNGTHGVHPTFVVQRDLNGHIFGNVYLSGVKANIPDFKCDQSNTLRTCESLYHGSMSPKSKISELSSHPYLQPLIRQKAITASIHNNITNYFIDNNIDNINIGRYLTVLNAATYLAESRADSAPNHIAIEDISKFVIGDVDFLPKTKPFQDSLEHRLREITGNNNITLMPNYMSRPDNNTMICSRFEIKERTPLAVELAKSRLIPVFHGDGHCRVYSTDVLMRELQASLSKMWNYVNANHKLPTQKIELARLQKNDRRNMDSVVNDLYNEGYKCISIMLVQCLTHIFGKYKVKVNPRDEKSMHILRLSYGKLVTQSQYLHRAVMAAGARIRDMPECHARAQAELREVESQMRSHSVKNLPIYITYDSRIITDQLDVRVPKDSDSQSNSSGKSGKSSVFCTPTTAIVDPYASTFISTENPVPMQVNESQVIQNVVWNKSVKNAKPLRQAKIHERVDSVTDKPIHTVPKDFLIIAPQDIRTYKAEKPANLFNKAVRKVGTISGKAHANAVSTISKLIFNSADEEDKADSWNDIEESNQSVDDYMTQLNSPVLQADLSTPTIMNDENLAEIEEMLEQMRIEEALKEQETLPSRQYYPDY